MRKIMKICVFYELQSVELDKNKKDRDTEIKELWKFLEKDSFVLLLDINKVNSDLEEEI